MRKRRITGWAAGDDYIFYMHSDGYGREYCPTPSSKARHRRAVAKMGDAILSISLSSLRCQTGLDTPLK